MLHQLLERDVRIINLRRDAIDDFAKVMRRNIGGHADRNTRAAVHQQIRERGWKHGWFQQALVVVRHEVDGRLVHVVHQRAAQVGEACLGITHGRRRIAFHASKVALAVHEGVAHRPRLGHVNERGVNNRFTVRMIVAASVTGDFRTLKMLFGRVQR